METIEASFSQFDFAHGSASCTSASVLFARYALEKVPTVADLDKLLRAAALLWKNWKDRCPSPYAFQTWKNVVDCFPGIFANVDILHESNGFIGEEVTEEGRRDYLMASVGDCVGRMQESESCAAVLTSSGSSYALVHRDGLFYFFDSHGSSRTGGRAYVLRIHSAEDLLTFVHSNFCPREFSCLIIRKKQSACTPDTPVSA